MKRVLALLVGLCLLASISFAGSQAEKAAAGPVTLRFSWWGNESRHKATLAAIDAFVKKNPNVKIEPEYGGFDGYYTKLATMIAGGSAPDVMQTDVKFEPDLRAQGDVFYDMYKLAGKIDTSGFERKFLEGWSIHNGKLVALPCGTNGQTTIMNATLMKQLGIPLDFAWTWEDMLEQGKRVKASNPDKYLLLLEPAQTGLHVVSAQVVQRTGRQLYDAATFARQYAREDLVAALTWVRQMLDAGLQVPFEQSAVFTDNQMENPMWLNGKAVMYLNYSTHVVRAVASAPGKIEVAVSKFPVLKNAKNSAIAVQPSMQLTINAKTRHINEAAAFVNFFLNDPDAIRVLKLERSVPSASKARELLEKEGMLDPTLAKAVSISLANAGLPPSLLMFNSEIGAIINEAVESVGFKKATPEEAAARMIQKVDAKLAELKAAKK